MRLGLLFQLTAGVPGAASTSPYQVGEVLEYSAHYSLFRPGSARLEVAGIDTVRGVPSWRFGFRFDVSFLMFSNHSVFTSWTGVADFSSRRFVREVEEKGKRRRDEYTIYPDSGFSRSAADTTAWPTPANPIDDVGFFYFLRSTPLVVGQTYRYQNYWRLAQNPATVEVLSRRTVTLPDGSKVPVLVLHPMVEAPKSMFSKRSRARLWLTDDARRLPVRIESTYSFGTVKLVLTKISSGS